jgi:hypothetical protein
MIHASTRRPDNDVRGLVRCVREVIEALDPGQAGGDALTLGWLDRRTAGTSTGQAAIR